MTTTSMTADGRGTVSTEDAMNVKEELPEVTYLITAYFFQNWDEVFGDDEKNVLRDLMTSEERATLVALRDDLDRLLAQGFTPEELRAYVDDLGAGPIEDDVGGFFADVRDVLDRHLAAS